MSQSLFKSCMDVPPGPSVLGNIVEKQFDDDDPVLPMTASRFADCVSVSKAQNACTARGDDSGRIRRYADEQAIASGMTGGRSMDVGDDANDNTASSVSSSSRSIQHASDRLFGYFVVGRAFPAVESHKVYRDVASTHDNFTKDICCTDCNTAGGIRTSGAEDSVGVAMRQASSAPDKALGAGYASSRLRHYSAHVQPSLGEETASATELGHFRRCSLQSVFPLHAGSYVGAASQRDVADDHVSASRVASTYAPAVFPVGSSQSNVPEGTLPHQWTQADFVQMFIGRYTGKGSCILSASGDASSSLVDVHMPVANASHPCVQSKDAASIEPRGKTSVVSELSAERSVMLPCVSSALDEARASARDTTANTAVSLSTAMVTGEDYFLLLTRALCSTVPRHQEMALHALLLKLHGCHVCRLNCECMCKPSSDAGQKLFVQGVHAALPNRSACSVSCPSGPTPLAVNTWNDCSVKDDSAYASAAVHREEAKALRQRCVQGPGCAAFLHTIIRILRLTHNPHMSQLAAACLVALLTSDDSSNLTAEDKHIEDEERYTQACMSDEHKGKLGQTDACRGSARSAKNDKKSADVDIVIQEDVHERMLMWAMTVGEIGFPLPDLPMTDADSQTSNVDSHACKDSASPASSSLLLSSSHSAHSYGDIDEMLRSPDRAAGLEALGFTAAVLTAMDLLFTRTQNMRDSTCTGVKNTHGQGNSDAATYGCGMAEAQQELHREHELIHSRIGGSDTACKEIMLSDGELLFVRLLLCSIDSSNIHGHARSHSSDVFSKNTNTNDCSRSTTDARACDPNTASALRASNHVSNSSGSSSLRDSAMQLAQCVPFTQWVHAMLGDVILGTRTLGSMKDVLLLLHRIAHVPQALRCLLCTDAAAPISAPSSPSYADGKEMSSSDMWTLFALFLCSCTSTTSTKSSHAFGFNSYSYACSNSFDAKNNSSTSDICHFDALPEQMSSTSVIRNMDDVLAATRGFLLLREMIRHGYGESLFMHALISDETFLMDGMNVGAALLLEMWFLLLTQEESCEGRVCSEHNTCKPRTTSATSITSAAHTTCTCGSAYCGVTKNMSWSSLQTYFAEAARVAAHVCTRSSSPLLCDTKVFPVHCEDMEICKDKAVRLSTSDSHAHANDDRDDEVRRRCTNLSHTSNDQSMQTTREDAHTHLSETTARGPMTKHNHAEGSAQSLLLAIGHLTCTHYLATYFSHPSNAQHDATKPASHANDCSVSMNALWGVMHGWCMDRDSSLDVFSCVSRPSERRPVHTRARDSCVHANTNDDSTKKNDSHYHASYSNRNDTNDSCNDVAVNDVCSTINTPSSQSSHMRAFFAQKMSSRAAYGSRAAAVRVMLQHTSSLASLSLCTSYHPVPLLGCDARTAYVYSTSAPNRFMTDELSAAQTYARTRLVVTLTHLCRVFYRTGNDSALAHAVPGEGDSLPNAPTDQVLLGKDSHAGCCVKSSTRSTPIDARCGDAGAADVCLMSEVPAALHSWTRCMLHRFIGNCLCVRSSRCSLTRDKKFTNETEAHIPRRARTTSRHASSVLLLSLQPAELSTALELLFLYAQAHPVELYRSCHAQTRLEEREAHSCHTQARAHTESPSSFISSTQVHGHCHNSTDNTNHASSDGENRISTNHNDDCLYGNGNVSKFSTMHHPLARRDEAEESTTYVTEVMLASLCILCGIASTKHCLDGAPRTLVLLLVAVQSSHTSSNESIKLLRHIANRMTGRRCECVAVPQPNMGDTDHDSTTRHVSGTCAFCCIHCRHQDTPQSYSLNNTGGTEDEEDADLSTATPHDLFVKYLCNAEWVALAESLLTGIVEDVHRAEDVATEKSIAESKACENDNKNDGLKDGEDGLMFIGGGSASRSWLLYPLYDAECVDKTTWSTWLCRLVHHFVQFYHRRHSSDSGMANGNELREANVYTSLATHHGKTKEHVNTVYVTHKDDSSPYPLDTQRKVALPSQNRRMYKSDDAERVSSILQSILDMIQCDMLLSCSLLHTLANRSDLFTPLESCACPERTSRCAARIFSSSCSNSHDSNLSSSSACTSCWHTYAWLSTAKNIMAESTNGCDLLCGGAPFAALPLSLAALLLSHPEQAECAHGLMYDPFFALYNSKKVCFPASDTCDGSGHDDCHTDTTTTKNDDIASNSAERQVDANIDGNITHPPKHRHAVDALACSSPISVDPLCFSAAASDALGLPLQARSMAEGEEPVPALLYAALTAVALQCRPRTALSVVHFLLDTPLCACSGAVHRVVLPTLCPTMSRRTLPTRSCNRPSHMDAMNEQSPVHWSKSTQRYCCMSSECFCDRAALVFSAWCEKLLQLTMPAKERRWQRWSLEEVVALLQLVAPHMTARAKLSVYTVENSVSDYDAAGHETGALHDRCRAHVQILSNAHRRDKNEVDSPNTNDMMLISNKQGRESIVDGSSSSTEVDDPRSDVNTGRCKTHVRGVRQLGVCVSRHVSLRTWCLDVIVTRAVNSLVRAAPGCAKHALSFLQRAVLADTVESLDWCPTALEPYLDRVR